MDPRVQQTIDRLEPFVRNTDDALALPRDAARFAYGLIIASGARHGVEIGTSYGYSGLWLAAGLAENGGRLVTIDKDERKIEAARRVFEEAGLDRFVELKLGAAAEVLESLAGSCDFVLNDADKETCVQYVTLLEARLTLRAIVLTDNTRTRPEQLRPFVEWIRGRSHFVSLEVPIGNGFELSILRRMPSSIGVEG